MSNPSYLRGRRLEYELCKLGRENGWSVIRASGSHGFADVVWFRMNGLGTVIEGLELIRANKWHAEPDNSKVVDPFLYGFYRFTGRGMNKHWIWVLPIADGYGQTLFIQAKTQLNKKKRTKA